MEDFFSKAAQNKNPMNNAKPKPAAGTPESLFANLAQEIIASLENGVVPWVRPWEWRPRVVVVGANEIEDIGWARNIAGPALPFGPLNGVVLQTMANAKGYRTNFWVAEERLRKLNACAKAGERPCEVTRFYPDQDVTVSFGSRRLYNLDQIEDLESLGVSVRDSRRHMGDFKFSYVRAESGLRDLNPNLDVRWGEKALYRPGIDRIEMPDVRQFVNKIKAGDQKRREREGEAHYWATLWHEVVHWTGHSSRLGRFSLEVRGKDDYAREELIAEFGAAFLCSHFGVRGRLQYASYIDSWLRGLKDDRAEVLQKSVKQAVRAWEWVRNKIRERRRQGDAAERFEEFDPSLDAD